MVRPFEVVRVRGDTCVAELDQAVAEEPLEIRLHRRPFAVIMRTPGADRELAAGFLLAERVIRSADDLGTIEHCSGNDEPRTTNVGEAAERRQRSDDRQNVVNVTLTGAAAADLERTLAGRRNVVTGS